MLSIVGLNDEILKITQPVTLTTLGYLYDVVIRQYFKGAFDVIAITMATVQLSVTSL